MAERASPGDVELVFESWRSRQPAPDRVKLGDERARLIAGALRAHSADELVTLIAYAYEADESDARYWRGENDQRRSYLGLTNLLGPKKLSDRVDRASAWAEGFGGAPADDDGDPVQLSPIGLLRRGGA